MNADRVFIAVYILTIALSFMATAIFCWLCWTLRSLRNQRYVLYWLFIVEAVHATTRLAHEGWWFTTRIVTSLNWIAPPVAYEWFWIASITVKMALAVSILGVVVWGCIAWRRYH